MKLVELLQKLNRLKEMPRTGWVLAGIERTRVEDVAQHSFEVASISLLLGETMVKSGYPLDLRKLLTISIIHDWSETAVGDFPYPALKYLSERGVKMEMERKALRELLSGSPDLISAWEEYSRGTTVEAKLVRAADLISMLVQATKYVERGHRSKELDELWNAVLLDLRPFVEEFPEVRELVDDVKKQWFREE